MLKSTKHNEAKTPRRFWLLGPLEAAADSAADRVEAELEVELALDRWGQLTLAS
jgi:hypothetical protein